MVAECNNSAVAIVHRQTLGGESWLLGVPIAGMLGMPYETSTEGSSRQQRTASGATEEEIWRAAANNSGRN